MVVPQVRTPASGGRGDSSRFPALLWSFFHAAALAALYAPSIVKAVEVVPPRYRAALWPTFVPQALLIGLLMWLVAVPLSRWPRLFRFAAPAVAGLATLVLAVDSQVYANFGIHLNGFFFSVFLQPRALIEIGISHAQLAGLLGGALVFLVADVAVGAWFLRRFASARRTWIVALTGARPLGG